MARCSVQIVFGLLLLLKVFRIESATIVNSDDKTPLNVAIIGAGASGLTTARHALAYGHDVTVYEQAEELGGVWIYSDEVGKDKYGLNVHTAMYKGLRYVFKFDCCIFSFNRLNSRHKHQ